MRTTWDPSLSVPELAPEETILIEKQSTKLSFSNLQGNNSNAFSEEDYSKTGTLFVTSSKVVWISENENDDPRGYEIDMKNMK